MARTVMTAGMAGTVQQPIPKKGKIRKVKGFSKTMRKGKKRAALPPVPVEAEEY